jgi:hypothetical protein
LCSSRIVFGSTICTMLSSRLHLLRGTALLLIAFITAPLWAGGRRRSVGSGIVPRPAHRILFIGNSLTEANNLPAMVCALARFRGFTATCESVTFGGFDLRDHLEEGSAVRKLEAEKWSIVVLQQGPSSLPDSRVLLRQWTAQFDPKIRAAGARPALYAVWPAEANFDSFVRVGESYRLAAQDVDGMLFPAGSAWLAAWKLDAGLQLYGPDRFHPSRLGTYLTALVFHRCIWGELADAFADPAIAQSIANGPLGADADHLQLLIKAAQEPSCDPLEVATITR